MDMHIVSSGLIYGGRGFDFHQLFQYVPPHFFLNPIERYGKRMLRLRPLSFRLLMGKITYQ